MQFSVVGAKTETEVQLVTGKGATNKVPTLRVGVVTLTDVVLVLDAPLAASETWTET